MKKRYTYRRIDRTDGQGVTWRIYELKSDGSHVFLMEVVPEDFADWLVKQWNKQESHEENDF